MNFLEMPGMDDLLSGSSRGKRSQRAAAVASRTKVEVGKGGREKRTTKSDVQQVQVRHMSKQDLTTTAVKHQWMRIPVTTKDASILQWKRVGNDGRPLALGQETKLSTAASQDGLDQDSLTVSQPPPVPIFFFFLLCVSVSKLNEYTFVCVREWHTHAFRDIAVCASICVRQYDMGHVLV